MCELMLYIYSESVLVCGVQERLIYGPTNASVYMVMDDKLMIEFLSMKGDGCIIWICMLNGD